MVLLLDRGPARVRATLMLTQVQSCFVTFCKCEQDAAQPRSASVFGVWKVFCLLRGACPSKVVDGFLQRRIVFHVQSSFRPVDLPH